MPTPERESKTIVLPMASCEDYKNVMTSSSLFKAWLEENYKKHPELFPQDFSIGYHLVGCTHSKKQKLSLRRIRLLYNKKTYQVRPSFLMPYMICHTADIEKALLLRRSCVPFRLMAYTFGRDPMFYYRAFCSLGRYSVVGTTIKREQALPKHIVADEKHIKCYGEKAFIATTVSQGCMLGASIHSSASTEELCEGYGEFAQELGELTHGFQPQSITVDGWEPTSSALRSLFPTSCVLLCFLHGWLSIRDRYRRDKTLKKQLAQRVWDVYEALSKASFSQRMRRLQEWAKETLPEGELKEKVLRLQGRRDNYAQAYTYPDAKRTSNEVDRLMDHQDRWLYAFRGLHGSHSSLQLLLRAFCLLWNFHPYTQSLSNKNGHSSPFHRCNGFLYHNTCWLQNLLIAASLHGRTPLHKM